MRPKQVFHVPILCLISQALPATAFRGQSHALELCRVVPNCEATTGLPLQAQQREGYDPPSTMSHPLLDPFTQKLVELYEYKEKYGDLLVPKRFPENPALGSFVNKQRQLFKKYLANETCSLTSERVDLLNQLEFVWDATSTPTTYVRPGKDTEGLNKTWLKFYSELCNTIEDRLSQLRDEDGHYTEPESLLSIHRTVATMLAMSKVTPASPLGKWIAEQRNQYQQWLDEKPSRLSEKERAALSSVDQFWWLQPRERVWRIRYYTLVSYKRTYSDTAIPMSFRSASLANWVSNQRQQHRLKRAGKKSNLTDAREERLSALGFTWSFEEVWDRTWQTNLNNTYLHTS